MPGRIYRDVKCRSRLVSLFMTACDAPFSKNSLQVRMYVPSSLCSSRSCSRSLSLPLPLPFADVVAREKIRYRDRLLRRAHFCRSAGNSPKQECRRASIGRAFSRRHFRENSGASEKQDPSGCDDLKSRIMAIRGRPWRAPLPVFSVYF